MAQRRKASASKEWQIYCTGVLQACYAQDALTGRRDWNKRKRALVAEAESRGVKPPRVVIADLSLRGASLKHWSFDHCYLARVDLTDADLRGADFDRAILRECRLVRADLRGSKLLRTSVDSNTLGWGAKIDRKSMLACTGPAENLSGFDPLFRRRAEEDQRIFNLKDMGWGPARIWYATIDYGRSIWRLALIAVAIISIFYLGYKFSYAASPQRWKSGNWSDADFLNLAVSRFINASSHVDSADYWIQAVFLLESTVGYAFLALLAAAIVRKLMILE